MKDTATRRNKTQAAPNSGEIRKQEYYFIVYAILKEREESSLTDV